MGSLYSDTDFQANMVTLIGADPRLTVASMDEIDEQKQPPDAKECEETNKC
jgi:hypothetical protein